MKTQSRAENAETEPEISEIKITPPAYIVICPHQGRQSKKAPLGSNFRTLMGACMANGKKTTYLPSFKEEAVRRYLEGGRSYQQLADELGLKDKKTLREWVTKFQRGESLEDGRGKATGSRRGRPRTQFASVEEELSYVKVERDYLKKLYRSRFGHEWGADKSGSISE